MIVRKHITENNERTMENKPIIGILADGKGGCPSGYITGVTQAGADYVMLRATKDEAVITAQTCMCDGFVFIGGPDINASKYGMENHSSMHLLDEELETFYLALAKKAIYETHKPVLGICLGCQLINVVMGGTLIRDIASAVPNSLIHPRPSGATAEIWHGVELFLPLRDVFGAGHLVCNSSHHQAVDKPGEGLIVAARACDGVTEAVALPNLQERFIIGTQWHPERILDKPRQQKVFNALVAAV